MAGGFNPVYSNTIQFSTKRDAWPHQAITALTFKHNFKLSPKK